MLVNSSAANLLVALNLLFINRIGAATVLSIVAIAQIIVSLIHLEKETRASVAEKIIFLFLFVGYGVVGFVTTAIALI